MQQLAELDELDLQSVREALANIDPQRYPLAEVAALHAGNATLVRVEHTANEPVRISHRGNESLVLVSVAAGVQATLVEAASKADFSNSLTVVVAEPGATVLHARSALESQGLQCALLHVQIAKGAEYQLQQYCVGAARRRSDIHILLQGERAQSDVVGAFVTEDGAHLDQQLVVEHLAPRTNSTQQIHGIGLGDSRSAFTGRIHIHPGAPKADAHLSNKNLSLDARAHINTKPELEIYTDDVACSHGATVGQLDPEQIFYLRSRGVPEARARSLLCGAFIGSCIRGPLAEVASQRLTEFLR